MTFARVAEICGVSKNTAVSWGQGAKIPAEALAALMREGLDVFYILVGRGQDAPQPVILDPDEVELVHDYRACDLAGRTALRQTATALAASAAAGGTSPTIRRPTPPPDPTKKKPAKKK